DSEGGYLVPDEYERTLVDALREENRLRTLCKIIRTASGDRKIPLVASHGTASWVEEEGTIPESDDAFGQITIGAHKIASMIKVSDELLQDSVFDVESYIATEFARRVGDAEEAAFISGDGSGKPYGLLNATNGAATGVTAASATALTSDELLDLIYSLKSPYRKRAVFLMHDSTIKAIRKLKDGNSQYLWQPGMKEGEPDRLLGYRLVTSTHMPAVAASAKPILFGDLSSYWIADREGRSMQRLNELYAATGQVGFRVTQRVDGRLVQAEGVKCLAMKSA
ncbi:MAG: phage major capsid protein, partial [Clostridiales bacterium]|nr:phage major capsid protein [Clostridiales bacterium]